MDFLAGIMTGLFAGFLVGSGIVWKLRSPGIPQREADIIPPTDMQRRQLEILQAETSPVESTIDPWDRALSMHEVCYEKERLIRLQELE